VNRIAADYDRYTGNAKRFYDERLDFTRTFAPVLAHLRAPAAPHGRGVPRA
jgi:hypothetical protein